MSMAEVRELPPPRETRSFLLRTLPAGKSLFVRCEGVYENRFAALSSRLLTDAKALNYQRKRPISGRLWHTQRSYRDGGVYIWWTPS